LRRLRRRGPDTHGSQHGARLSGWGEATRQDGAQAATGARHRPSRVIFFKELDMRCSLVAVIAVLIPAAAFAQEFRATISGVVTDPTGAAVPGAKVVATETQTNTKTQTVSGAGGHYALPFLLPGNYRVTAQAAGFKEFARSGVQIGSGEHPVIDIQLEIGEASQTIEVTAAAPLINSDNATVGQAITTKQVEDLPMNGRTPLVLASLAVGVMATGQPSLIHPFDAGGASGWSIAGAPAQTNAVLLDGSPDATWDGRLAYSPPADAVEEVRVKAFDADAAFGHTNGGTMNQILKSGTNAFHGSAWEFNEPNTLTANNFFSNAKGLGVPVTHYNQYGVTVGGPVLIPKIYNGRNKLFWFFAWEGLKDSQPNPEFLSVPTDAERQGNFAGLGQLYDPYSAVLNGKTVTRSPYPNNQIPTSELNPISMNMLQFFPEPNLASSNGFDNYGSNTPTTDDYNNELARVDYNLSDRDRVFVDFRRTGYLQNKNNYFNNNVMGSDLTRDNLGTALDNVYTINPTNVLDVRLNFTRMAETHPSPNAGFDPTTLGFPSYIDANSQYLQIPYFALASATSTTQIKLGDNGANILPSQSLQLFATWVTVKGSHTLKFGVDLRQYNLNATSFGDSVGGYNFTSNTWVRAASNSSSSVAQGQDLAEFLLGLPTSGEYDINAAGAYYEHYYAGFVQDDWRVTHTLTLNLGVRFDYDAPWNEKYGRTVNGFDTTTPNPLAAAAIAAYNANPIPEIPAGSFNVPGGLTYPSDGAIYQQNSHMLSPRVGFAWAPASWHDKTVFRGGFAIFTEPVDITQYTLQGKYSTNPILSQYGFSQTTTFVPSNDSYVTPAATISNPFPDGIDQPVGRAEGLATFNGQSVALMAPQQKDPYSVRWNFGIQQQLTHNMMVEADYVGSHGVHLPVYVTDLNPVPAQYLSTLPVRDNGVVTELTGTTPNPFYGLDTAVSTQKTTSVAQLLTPFPEFPIDGVTEYNNPIGSSDYEALYLRLEKRFSNGLSLIGNYAHSKLIERDLFLNPTDTTLEKRISPYDFPNRFVLAASYELPFGVGRRFAFPHRWEDMILGGWGFNNIYTYQTGAPVEWTNGSSTSPGDYVYFGAPLDYNNRQTDGPAFNTSAFDTASADQFEYHIRTFPSTLSSVRADGINEWETSLTKRFIIRESMYFELRGEAYNVLNHPTFAAPNLVATNKAFGTITSQANRPRTIQLGARFVF
jgi:Carboxypeptidase regulatory-like domain